MSPLPHAGELGDSDEGRAGKLDKMTQPADAEPSPPSGDASPVQPPKGTWKNKIRKLFDVGRLPCRKRKKKREPSLLEERNEQKGTTVRPEEESKGEEHENTPGFQVPTQHDEPKGGTPARLNRGDDAELRPAEGTVHTTNSDSSMNYVIFREGSPDNKELYVKKELLPGYSPSSDVSGEEDESQQCYRSKWPWRKLSRGLSKSRIPSTRRKEMRKAKRPRSNDKRNTSPSQPSAYSKIEPRKNKKRQKNVESNQPSLAQPEQPSEGKSEQEQKNIEKKTKKSGCNWFYGLLYILFCLVLTAALFAGEMYGFFTDQEEASFLVPRSQEVFGVEVISAGLLWIAALFVLCTVRKNNCFLELLVALIAALCNMTFVHLPKLIFHRIGELMYFEGSLWLLAIVVPLFVLSIIVSLVAVARLC